MFFGRKFELTKIKSYRLCLTRFNINCWQKKKMAKMKTTNKIRLTSDDLGWQQRERNKYLHIIWVNQPSNVALC